MIEKYFYKGNEYTATGLSKLASKMYGNNIKPTTIAKRLENSRKWTVDRALSTPTRSSTPYVYRGNHYSLSELQEIANRTFDVNISAATLNRRLKQLGWSVEKSISTKSERAPKKNALQRAQKNYAKSHSKKIQEIQAKSYSRSFIRNYATLDIIKIISHQIEKQLETGKYEDITWPDNQKMLHEAKVNRKEYLKYRNCKYRFKTFLSKYAIIHQNDETLKELLKLASERKKSLEQLSQKEELKNEKD